MNKQFYFNSALATVIIFLVACTSVNQVSTASKIQKRRYNSGYFVSNIFKTKHKNHASTKAISDTILLTKAENKEIQANIDNQLAQRTVVSQDIDDKNQSIVTTVAEAITKSKTLYNPAKTSNIKQYLADKKAFKQQIQSKLILGEGAKKSSGGGKSSGGSGKSIASFVLGMVGLIIAGLICGTLAIIFGIIALNKGNSLKGLAIAGLILGILDVLLSIIALVFLSSLGVL